MSQRKYCLDVLNDVGLIDAKPCETPMIPNVKLTSEDGELLEKPEVYRKIVGKLNYLTLTRPSIAFPISVVSQFMFAPRTSLLDAISRILRYLKDTPGRRLFYQNHGHHIVDGFTNVDYARNLIYRHSTTRYCVFVGDNLVFWKNKKQNAVSRSSAEFEYRAMTLTTFELVWLHYLLDELGFIQT